MSGLLDGLRRRRPTYVQGRVDTTVVYNKALNDVREALRSESIRTLLWTAVEDELPPWPPTDCAGRIVAAVLAVLAGDDQ